ncbi:hypothetical protein KC207_01250 [Phycicoccus sp. BSK3Z-2]|uniref:Uncharacterized protein n=1 Tax=Phycicoccus avicenniae TaxID=2828860 RepID=A0A941D7G1_9MICO|nr:hypothetical protein [Phycicoccus avicenniae]MBR7741917.1 hypothetical protein [Phycicoccus avicenniae]
MTGGQDRSGEEGPTGGSGQDGTDARSDGPGELTRVRGAELLAAATVALLDVDRARELTADALHAVTRDWSAHEATPTAAARRELLRRLTHERRAPASTTGPDTVDARLRSAAEDPASAVPHALLDALADQPPAVRAVLAAPHLWHLDDDELARLLPPGHPTDDDLDTARTHLLTAHRTARADDGLAPADDLLPHDLDHLLQRLATEADPAHLPDLVHARTRRRRRRALTATVTVTAALAAAALGAAGVLGPDAPAADEAATPVGTLPASAPEWESLGGWPIRGDAASDPAIRGLVAVGAAESRPVFAGDVGDLRVVVAVRAPVGFADGSVVSAWVGPAGAPADRLTAVSYESGFAVAGEEVLAVGLPVTRDDGRLLVLARPDLPEVQVTGTVTPTPEGDVVRDAQAVPLEGGVGLASVGDGLPVTSRVLVDDALVTRPVLPRSWVPDLGGPGPDPQESAPTADYGWTLPYVEAATGIPQDDLDVRALVDTRRRETAFDPAGTRAPYRVRLAAVTTPDGGVLRLLEVRGVDPDVVRLLTSPEVVPADRAAEPFVLWFDPPGRDDRYLVLTPDTPDGRVRITWTAPEDADLPPVEGVVRDGVAVLPMASEGRSVDPESVLLEVRGPDGELVHDGPPLRGTSLDEG